MDDLMHLVQMTGLRLSKLASSGPTWAYPSYEVPNLPSQGIKLHVSATILSAKDVFNSVVPFLLEKRILFKVISTIKDLQRLNAGLFGVTQVGKFITVYPTSQKEAFALADKLHDLTSKFRGPRVISDYKYKGIIYFRYGAFRPHLESENGVKKYLLESPEGKVTEDTRDPRYPLPNWFKASIVGENREQNCDYLSRFIITSVLRQRGRGGIYRGIELQRNHTSHDKKVRKIILKQARYLGEVEPTGVDAQVRLLWYFRLLNELLPLKIAPQPYGLFSCGEDIFLVMQDLDGISLSDLLLNYNYTPTPDDTLEVLIKIARIVILLHNRGILIVDLSPDNVIVTPNEIYVVDLEYAWRADGPPYSPMGTVGFVLPDLKMQAPTPQRDIMALGAIGYAMLSPTWLRELYGKLPVGTINEDEIVYSMDKIWDKDKKLAKIISKCLKMQYTSVRVLYNDLLDLRGKYGGINQSA